jgi:hypothetical protein
MPTGDPDPSFSHFSTPPAVYVTPPLDTAIKEIVKIIGFPSIKA